jgi:transposase
MLNHTRIEKVHLALGFTDLRKSVDGLALVVQHILKLDPFSTHLFAFCNKRQDKIKILVWDNNGFWLHYKRLEHGKFKWPARDGNPSDDLTEREFRWLLDGLSHYQEKAHSTVEQRVIL